VDSVDVLVVGAGLAGARCAETLRSVGFDGSILVAGDEPHLPYERPALSKGLLLGTCTAASLTQRPEEHWSDQAIEITPNAPVDDLDLDRCRATVGSRSVAWRHLVIATGARARRLPGLAVVGGVHYLRTLGDARGLLADLRTGGRLVVIGAGFVGAEVASTARELGLEVAIIEDAPIPLARVLGPEAGTRMATRIREHRVDLRLGTRLRRLIERGGRVRGVELSDGERLACNLVLIGVGAVPNADMPCLAPLRHADDGGVVTDACGRTDHSGVFACASAIVGVERPDHSPPFFWSDQFGWRLQMVGESGAHLRAELSDDEGDGFLVRYTDPGGPLRGGLAVNRPEALAPMRQELLDSAPAALSASTVGKG
jgi:NADPH-dependent 2,4-dienoyl-CoA reductase/sulfur reductase-like enzyme